MDKHLKKQLAPEQEQALESVSQRVDEAVRRFCGSAFVKLNTTEDRHYSIVITRRNWIEFVFVATEYRSCDRIYSHGAITYTPRRNRTKCRRVHVRSNRQLE